MSPRGVSHVRRWFGGWWLTLLSIVAVLVLVAFAVELISTAKKADRTARQAKVLSKENAVLATKAARFALANHQLVLEIQASRVLSCKRTYRSFAEFFDPFFPPPAQRTAKQRSDFAKLHARAAELIRERCPVQTALKKQR